MSASFPRRLAARFRRWFLGEKLWQQSRPGVDRYDPVRLNIKALGYQLARELGPRLTVVEPSGEPRPHGLGSKATTQADVESGWFAHWCRQLRIAPIYHRKLWEYAFVLQVLHEHDRLRPGLSGLGFGCGEEPIPSYLASRGVAVTVTDLGPEQSAGRGWVETGQHTTSIEKAWKPELVDRQRFDSLVRLVHVDMNRIPSALDGQHDFCWSICAMEHLGSIELGLRFVDESLRALRPGGIAIHTTEFNFLSELETVGEGPTVLFLRRHFEEIAHRLERSGHRVGRLDFDVGDGAIDRYIDVPPYAWDSYPCVSFATGQVHLKLALDGFPSTCFGIWVEKAASS